MVSKRLNESWFSQGSKRFRNLGDFTVVSALYTWERMVSYLTPLQTAQPNVPPSPERLFFHTHNRLLRIVNKEKFLNETQGQDFLERRDLFSRLPLRLAKAQREAQ